jgi:hypothetical protein
VGTAATTQMRESGACGDRATEFLEGYFAGGGIKRLFFQAPVSLVPSAAV